MPIISKYLPLSMMHCNANFPLLGVYFRLSLNQRMIILDAICYESTMDRFICSKLDFLWVKALHLVLILPG